jgi:hypothetical protein
MPAPVKAIGKRASTIIRAAASISSSEAMRASVAIVVCLSVFPEIPRSRATARGRFT